jgi:hypothetical protein
MKSQAKSSFHDEPTRPSTLPGRIARDDEPTVPTVIPEMLARAVEQRLLDEPDRIVAAHSLEPSEPHLLLSIPF